MRGEGRRGCRRGLHPIQGPLEEVPTRQPQIRESRLAPRHQLPAMLIHQEPDTAQILARLGGGRARGFADSKHPFCCLRVINRLIKSRMS